MDWNRDSIARRVASSARTCHSAEGEVIKRQEFSKDQDVSIGPSSDSSKEIVPLAVIRGFRNYELAKIGSTSLLRDGARFARKTLRQKYIILMLRAF